MLTALSETPWQITFVQQSIRFYNVSYKQGGIEDFTIGGFSLQRIYNTFTTGW